MPYIKEDQRKMLDEKIDALAEEIVDLYKNLDVKPTRDGLLNYSITRMLNKVFPNARYHDYNEVIGMLECCKLEYYRKYIGPYEDLKESENGKVDTFNDKDQKNSY